MVGAATGKSGEHSVRLLGVGRGNNDRIHNGIKTVRRGQDFKIGVGVNAGKR